MSALRLLVAAPVVATAMLAGPSAGAATVGSVTVTPATGTDLTPFTLTTSGACPGGTNVIATIFGPGFTADGENIVPNLSSKIYPHTATGGVVLPISDTLRDFANDQPDPQPLKGTYRLRVMCRMNAKLGDLGDFIGSITFGPGHGYVAKNPGLSAAALATVAPLPPSAAPRPSVTAPATVIAARPAASSTSSGGVRQLAPWLLGLGAISVAGGLSLALRARRAKRAGA